MTQLLARLEEALGHPDRLRLYTILLQDELCFCELESMIALSSGELDRHLTVLQDCELLQSREEDSQVYYQARSNPVREVRERIIRNSDELDWHELSRLIRQTKGENLCRPAPSV